MKLAPLVTNVAHQLGLDHGTVHVHAQGLRVGGLITKGGRGFAGAEMLQSDASNLVLACVAQPPARQVAEIITHIRNLPLMAVSEEGEGLDGRIEMEAKPKDVPLAFDTSTLGATLDGLFEAMMFDRDIVSDFQPGVVEWGALIYRPHRTEFDLVLRFSYGSMFTMRYRRKDVPAKNGIVTQRSIDLSHLAEISKLLSIPSPDATIALVPRSAGREPSRPRSVKRPTKAAPKRRTKHKK